ncbi:hypothetical protein BDZ89DRAFT_1078581 [Hymenopellis radicata]|nr:hypothetical protein BDZ89DRAFT_1078581 [Hymenopellis radicata]
MGVPVMYIASAVTTVDALPRSLICTDSSSSNQERNNSVSDGVDIVRGLSTGESWVRLIHIQLSYVLQFPALDRYR